MNYIQVLKVTINSERNIFILTLAMMKVIYVLNVGIAMLKVIYILNVAVRGF